MFSKEFCWECVGIPWELCCYKWSFSLGTWIGNSRLMALKSMKVVPLTHRCYEWKNLQYYMFTHGFIFNSGKALIHTVKLCCIQVFIIFNVWDYNLAKNHIKFQKANMKEHWSKSSTILSHSENAKKNLFYEPFKILVTY